MTIQPNSTPASKAAADLPNQDVQENAASLKSNETKPSLEASEANRAKTLTIPPSKPVESYSKELSSSWLILGLLTLMGVGLWLHWTWLGLTSSLVALYISGRVIWPSWVSWFGKYLTAKERQVLVGFSGFLLAIAGLCQYLGVYRNLNSWLNQFKYDEFGSWAEWVGALGQISIAVLAVYVAWQQYVISKDLTIKQNRITQQQTIDAYFQGISDLTLDNEGMLEDWPQERAIAEGRTAALLSNVDATGKAQILRFLSQSRFLTPLMRDRHLGRPILDGSGGYAEDRAEGIRVIDLGVMLAGCDLSGTDLRWTDLSDANLVRANLSHCDLVKANLSRTVLYEAKLTEADLKGVRLFYGSLETASPRSRQLTSDYETGAHTGVVIEKADLSGVKNLSEENRYYCCCWGGEKTRATIPGGCAGIPPKLGR